MFRNLIWIQQFNNLDNICTEFKSRQFLFLFGSNNLIILIIYGQNSKVDNFCSVSNIIFGGIELLLSIDVHCQLNQLLICFLQKTFICWFPTSNEGGDTILFSSTNFFKVFPIGFLDCFRVIRFNCKTLMIF